jgi:exopolysaccharide biosynthesis polyprenyl glycosylphosphotransferase
MSSMGVEGSHVLLETSTYSDVSSEAERRSARRSRFEWAVTAIEIAGDWFAVVLAIHAAYFAYNLLCLGHRLPHPYRPIGLISFIVAALAVFLFDCDGAYRSGSGLLGITETARSLRVSGQALVLVLLAANIESPSFSRWVFVFAMLSIPLLQVLEKHALYAAVRSLRARGIGMQKALIYGAGSDGRRVFSALARSPKFGLNPVIFVDDDPEMKGQRIYESGYQRRHSAEVISGPVSQEMIERYDCEWLILAKPGSGSETLLGAIKAAYAAGIPHAFVPEQTDLSCDSAEQVDIDGVKLCLVNSPQRDWWYERTKRAADILLGLLVLILSLPILLAAALLVRLDSSGSSLFWQQRVGRYGYLFDLCKFRSMREDAPKYSCSPTNAKDPRITPFGRVLRHASFDELPQLFNVLKGEMSLVGPRPEMPFIAQQYNHEQRKRLDVIPGITGLWQLSADRASAIHQNICYDLYYIQHRSFFLDIAILLHTPGVLMRGV